MVEDTSGEVAVTMSVVCMASSSRLVESSLWVDSFSGFFVSDSLSISPFSSSLYFLPLASCSRYHLEANGQAERTNQTLEQYLRVYCNYQQDNWSELLPLAEFAYNNAPSTTTGVSPFFANKGYHPNLLVYPERDIASSRARDFVVDLDELQSTLKEEIAKAQRQYQPSANSCRQQSPDFQVGEPVFVRSQYFWTTRPSKKLSEKYLGPYEIIARPSMQSFTLHLPDTMKAIHPVFHVSMLEPAIPNTFQQHSEPLPAPVIIDREPEYKISKIVDSKIDHQRVCKLLYKVIWLGYEDTDNDSEWLPATELEHAKELLSDFHL